MFHLSLGKRIGQNSSTMPNKDMDNGSGGLAWIGGLTDGPQYARTLPLDIPKKGPRFFGNPYILTKNHLVVPIIMAVVVVVLVLQDSRLSNKRESKSTTTLTQSSLGSIMFTIPGSFLKFKLASYISWKGDPAILGAYRGTLMLIDSAMLLRIARNFLTVSETS